MKTLGVLLCAAIACSACTQHAQGNSPAKVSDYSQAYNPEAAIAQGVLAEIGGQHDDVQRGSRVVLGLEACKPGRTCFSCVQCHGVQGQGGAMAPIPRLAGQNKQYLLTSLQRFASGERINSPMHDVASALTAQQMSDVAAYYSAIPAARLPTASGASGQPGPGTDLGERIAQQGMSQESVPPCDTCPAALYYSALKVNTVKPLPSAQDRPQQP